MSTKEFSGINELPSGQAKDTITRGCIVLEGGAFRGVYGEGVLDALMEADINFECTIGCSAGAMNGLNYVAGQIGRSARTNLKYRYDKRYIGLKAYRNNKGLVGFDFVLDSLNAMDPINEERLNQAKRRLVVVAANCKTGKAEYFEKGKCPDILQAVRASASMPFVSRPVPLGNSVYLDGGCSDKIPFQWAFDQGYEKVVVVRTREPEYRKKISSKRANKATDVFYRKFPKFAKSLDKMNKNYNDQCAEIDRLNDEGRLYAISPSEHVTVGRLEKDMEKLGDLYYLGYNDTKNQLYALNNYLKH